MSTLVKPNGLIEDIAQEIGFEATMRLIAIYGGRSPIYIPGEAPEDHPVTRVIGSSAMRRLCESIGPTHLRVPDLAEFQRLRTLRSISNLVVSGYTVDAIGTLLGLSARQVHRYRVQAEEIGLIPTVLGRASSENL